MNISVECPSDFGANLVQHFIKRYSRYSRYRTKSHDKATISHDITRYQTVFLKLEEIRKQHPQGVYLALTVFGGCRFLIPPRTEAVKLLRFVIRAKNSPPDCFLYALTVLKEIKIAPTGCVFGTHRFWWVPFSYPASYRGCQTLKVCHSS